MGAIGLIGQLHRAALNSSSTIPGAYAAMISLDAAFEDATTRIAVEAVINTPGFQEPATPQEWAAFAALLAPESPRPVQS